MKIKLIKFDDNLQPPKRAHYNDAGADIFAPADVYIPKGQTVKVPLGFGVEIPNGYMGCIYSRSSLSAKGLACEMPPIDSGYRGEIHAVITNHTSEMQKLEKGSRIGQLVIHPIAVPDFVDNYESERGGGAFGSTGA